MAKHLDDGLTAQERYDQSAKGSRTRARWRKQNRDKLNANNRACRARKKQKDGRRAP